MKILYLSCHSILEYDELKLFTELGHQVYSLGGAYQSPNASDGKRPPIPELPYDPHFIELAVQYSKDQMIAEQLEGFDCVMVMHTPKWIESNWHILEPFIKRGKRVIWRSIGQSVPHIEVKLAKWRAAGVELVRYSPAEKTIANFAGEDAMIRFYKDPHEFHNWNGHKKEVINFTQSMVQRGRFVGYSTFKEVTRPFESKVYGPGNRNLGTRFGGMLEYADMKQAYRDNRVYLYTGTYPASYTLTFIEAMMTGIPIVSVGKQLGNGEMFEQQQTFEVPDIIVNGRTGFVADNVKELQAHIINLLEDDDLAKSISLYSRQQAVELFGKSNIKRAWRDYLL